MNTVLQSLSLNRIQAHNMTMNSIHFIIDKKFASVSIIINAIAILTSTLFFNQAQ